jgi:hypothetical protein
LSDSSVVPNGLRERPGQHPYQDPVRQPPVRRQPLSTIMSHKKVTLSHHALKQGHWVQYLSTHLYFGFLRATEDTAILGASRAYMAKGEGILYQHRTWCRQGSGGPRESGLQRGSFAKVFLTTRIASRAEELPARLPYIPPSPTAPLIRHRPGNSPAERAGW